MPKAWFITGASSGLGRRLTEMALSEGDTVTATVRRTDARRDLTDRYDGRLTVEELDLGALKAGLGRLEAQEELVRSMAIAG